MGRVLQRSAPAPRAPGSSRVWFLVPQAVSRLSSLYVFAAVAQRTSAEQLGALTLGTTMAGAALALAVAVVGKPLASLPDPAVRGAAAARAQSAAVAGSLLVGLALAVAAVPTSGLVSLALACGALGVPAVMAVESTYWRTVHVDGPRAAGLELSAAYLLQALVVTAAAVRLDPVAVVLSPFVGLAAVAVVLLARRRDLTRRGAREWSTTSRATWLPYAFGVAASTGLLQAIPAVLGATSGLAAASTYRAGELSFGGTNLLISVSTQALLTQGTDRPRQVYLRTSAALAVVAGLNGLAIALLPGRLLEAVVGPAAPLLVHVLGATTLQRAALAVSSVGAVLLVPLVSARRHGLLDVVAALSGLTLLLAGGVTAGLQGALTGLAASEVLLAVLYGSLLRRAR